MDPRTPSQSAPPAKSVQQFLTKELINDERQGS
jgi:hypothetical protein